MSKLVQGDAGTATAKGLSAWTIRRWRLTEGLPHIWIGGRVFYNLDSVDAWLASRETSGTATDEPEAVGVIREIKA